MGRPPISDVQSRVNVSMPQDLRQEIEDYRYANRISSEAEAIRRLVKVGLAAEKRRRGE